MLIQIVLLIVGLLTITTGYYDLNHFFFEQKQNQNMVQETATAWENFASSLNSYVTQNTNNITQSETVSCQFLINNGYYNGSCVDPVGQEMEGVIAAPFGFPQSWGAISETGPNPTILGKYGIGNAGNIVEQSLKWHSFLYSVDAILQGDNLVADVYNGNSGTFREPFGTNSSNYSNYSLIATPATYGQNINGIGPDGLMVFPQLHKEPGYWLWRVQLLDSDNESTVSFQNDGYSAVCLSGGVSPVPFDSANSPWQQNGIMGAATYFYPFFNGESSAGAYVNNLDPSNPFNFQEMFVCIPAPQALVNQSASYNPFSGPSPNNLSGNTVNPSYNSNYWNGDAQNTTQYGEMYLISVGSQDYTLIAYAGDVGSTFPGNGCYTGRLLEIALYQGFYGNSAQYAAAYGSGVAPSLFGGVQWNNNGGYYASPVVYVPSMSVLLN